MSDEIDDRQEDTDQLDLFVDVEPRTKVTVGEVPVRYILTPFPANDIKSGIMSEYRRETRVGKKVFAITMKSMMPLSSPRFEQYRSSFLIPAGEIAYNLHALILGDIRRAMSRGSRDPLVVQYKSLTEIANRIHVTAQTKNRHRIEAIFWRLRWLTMIYEENGTVVTGDRDKLISFATDSASLGNQDDKALALRVTEDYMKYFGRHTVAVDEDVYMGLPSAFSKFLYSWMVYASKSAAAKGLPAYESNRGQIVQQFTGAEMNRNNVGRYNADIDRWVMELCKLDPSLDAEYDGENITVAAREKRIIIRDETDERKTAVPAPTEIVTPEQGLEFFEKIKSSLGKDK